MPEALFFVPNVFFDRARIVPRLSEGFWKPIAMMCVAFLPYIPETWEGHHLPGLFIYMSKAMGTSRIMGGAANDSPS